MTIPITLHYADGTHVDADLAPTDIVDVCKLIGRASQERTAQKVEAGCMTDKTRSESAEAQIAELRKGRGYARG